MQIFAVDNDPKLAARALCDRHVVKMILESYMLLELAFGFSDNNWKHHPAAKWVKRSPDNIAWLFEHGKELCAEYTRRYGKIHSWQDKYIKIEHLITGNWRNHQEFCQLIPEPFKSTDPVQGYQTYYREGRVKDFTKWKLDNKPEWVS